MRHSAPDLMHVFLRDPGALELMQMGLLGLILAALGVGVRDLVRARRATPTGELPTRGPRVSVGLGVLAVLVGVAALSHGVYAVHAKIHELGANVTPADLGFWQMDAFLSMTAGLLIGALGIAGGWGLEGLGRCLLPAGGDEEES